MPCVQLTNEDKVLLTYIKKLGGYNSLQEALEESIDEYYKHVVTKYVSEDK